MQARIAWAWSSSLKPELLKSPGQSVIWSCTCHPPNSVGILVPTGPMCIEACRAGRCSTANILLLENASRCIALHFVAFDLEEYIYLRVDHVADLPSKLNLALRALSISRVSLAQKLQVDKSLVGRWLSGAVHPTEHNLTRLTHLLAADRPQFTHGEWFAPIERFAEVFGVAPPTKSSNGSGVDHSMLAEFVAASSEETRRRGPAYSGLWRTARPSVLMPGQIFHDYGLILADGDGVAEVLMRGSGLDFRGHMLCSGGNIFSFLFDGVGQSPLSIVLKGVTLPRAMVLDGIVMLAALDPSRTPAAMPIIMQRVCDLTGERERDLALIDEMSEAEPLKWSPWVSQP